MRSPGVTPLEVIVDTVADVNRRPEPERHDRHAPAPRLRQHLDRARRVLDRSRSRASSSSTRLSARQPSPNEESLFRRRRGRRARGTGHHLSRRERRRSLRLRSRRPAARPRRRVRGGRRRPRSHLVQPGRHRRRALEPPARRLVRALHRHVHAPGLRSRARRGAGFATDFPTVSGTTPFLPIPTIAGSYRFGSEKQFAAAFGVYAPDAAILSYPDDARRRAPRPSAIRSSRSADRSSRSSAGGSRTSRPVGPARRRRPDADGLLQDDRRPQRVPARQPGVRARRTRTTRRPPR